MNGKRVKHFRRIARQLVPEEKVGRASRALRKAYKGANASAIELMERSIHGIVHEEGWDEATT